MPDGYELQEGRYLQYRSATSAANGLAIGIGPVPAGKIWTILAGYATCTVAETQIYWWALLDPSATYYYPVVRPVSFAVAPAVGQHFPLLTEGMELKVFAGEYIYAMRAAATAGSTLTAVYRIIETDLPLYTYLEPQEVKRLKNIASQALHGMQRSGGGFVGTRDRTGRESERGSKEGT